MLRFFLNILISMSLFLLSVSCKEESEQMSIKQKCSVQTIEGENNNVIGEWRLIREDLIFNPAGPTEIDFSCDDVVYTFSEDGIVSISSDIDTHKAYTNGKYLYEFKNTSTPVSTLIINGITWPCQVIASKMILDNSPTDGGRLTFYRTKK